MERAVLEKSLKSLLEEKRSNIIKKWFEAVVETYTADVASHMRNTSAQFTNPMGHNFFRGLEGLFDGLMKGVLTDTASDFLSDIVRLRALQEFTPSQAVAFIFQLKRLVREELKPEIAREKYAEELIAFDSSVDDLGLFAFDLYMKCRERLYDIKAKEAQNATFRLLQKARIIVGEDVK